MPGSTCVPWHDLVDAPAGIDPERPVAVLCTTGPRAATAAGLLARQGFQAVIHVAEGGVRTWVELGLHSRSTSEQTLGRGMLLQASSPPFRACRSDGVLPTVRPSALQGERGVRDRWARLRQRRDGRGGHASRRRSPPESARCSRWERSERVAAPARTAATSLCDLPGEDDGHPVSRWGDGGRYFLLDNGGFKSGSTGWTLAGGAKVVSGNESYAVNRSRTGSPQPSGRRERAVGRDLLRRDRADGALDGQGPEQLGRAAQGRRVRAHADLERRQHPHGVDADRQPGQPWNPSRSGHVLRSARARCLPPRRPCDSRSRPSGGRGRSTTSTSIRSSRPSRPECRPHFRR